MSRVDEYLSEGEEVVAETSRSRIDTLFLRYYTISAVALVAGLVVFTGFVQVPASGIVVTVAAIAVAVPAVWVELQRYAHSYYFTDRKVIELTGILSVTTITVYYNEITHTELRQKWYDRILGHGDIQIDTAGEGENEIVLRAIHAPQKYQNILEGRRSDPAAEEDEQRARASRNESASTGVLDRGELEGELGRIERRRSQLQQSYEAGEIDQETYEQRWYALEGEERQIQRLLDRLE